MKPRIEYCTRFHYRDMEIWRHKKKSDKNNKKSKILNLPGQIGEIRMNRAIGRMSRIFAHGRVDRGSLPVWVITKTQKLVPGAALFNTQHYKLRIKGKMDQSREWSSALPYTSV